MSDPLIKTEFCNLPLSIPVAWRDFIDSRRGVLGLSRNAALCLCIKCGGPLLDKYTKLMRAHLEAELIRLDQISLEISVNVGPAQNGEARATDRAHERAKRGSSVRT